MLIQSFHKFKKWSSLFILIIEPTYTHEAALAFPASNLYSKCLIIIALPRLPSLRMCYIIPPSKEKKSLSWILIEYADIFPLFANRGNCSWSHFSSVFSQCLAYHVVRVQWHVRRHGGNNLKLMFAFLLLLDQTKLSK